MKVSAKTKNHPQPVTVEVNIPEKLADLTKHFGEEVVTSQARGAIVISAQATIRRLMEKGEKHEEIAKKMATWKPDLRVPGKSTFEKTVSAIDKLSPEDRKALLAKLQSAKA